MDSVLIGYKNGLAVYVRESLIAEIGISKAWRLLGLPPARYFPINTDLSGGFVNIEADSHEEALQIYLASRARV